MSRTGLTPLALACALLLAGCLSACGGSSPPDDGPGPPKDAALEVDLVSGTAGLDTEERAEVQSTIGDVLSEYVVEGFLGDYPREDFVRALDQFTAGAARGAARDIDLLTAARFSGSDRVRATRLRARISCLTVEGDVVGATAHVDFAFAVRGGRAAPQQVTLSGRFMLDRDEGTWSIFGYDVVRDDAERVTS